MSRSCSRALVEYQSSAPLRLFWGTPIPKTVHHTWLGAGDAREPVSTQKLQVSTACIQDGARLSHRSFTLGAAAWREKCSGPITMQPGNPLSDPNTVATQGLLSFCIWLLLLLWAAVRKGRPRTLRHPLSLDKGMTWRPSLLVQTEKQLHNK